MNEWPAAVIILLFGFALLTEHYWSRMFLKLFQNRRRKQSVAPPIADERLVLDNAMNRGSTFWRQYIGKHVKVIRMGPDGLADVTMAEQPVEVQGVAVERFSVVGTGDLRQ